jgi:hypothetical protein
MNISGKFTEMTKRAPKQISATRKWGIIGTIFILIMAICFFFGMSSSQKQETPKPFTAFGEDMAKKMETSITLPYIFTPNIKFSVYHVGKKIITNIDIQPDRYAIKPNEVSKTTIITFKKLIKGEKYIFVKEPYDPKFPEVPFTF